MSLRVLWASPSIAWGLLMVALFASVVTSSQGMAEETETEWESLGFIQSEILNTSNLVNEDNVGQEGTATSMECPPGCVSCSSAGACEECIPGLYLSMAVTETVRCVAECNEGFFGSNLEKPSCIQCHDTCNDCVGPDPAECTLCKEGLVFNKRENGYGECTTEGSTK